MAGVAWNLILPEYCAHDIVVPFFRYPFNYSKICFPSVDFTILPVGVWSFLFSPNFVILLTSFVHRQNSLTHSSSTLSNVITHLIPGKIKRYHVSIMA